MSKTHYCKSARETKITFRETTRKAYSNYYAMHAEMMSFHKTLCTTCNMAQQNIVSLFRELHCNYDSRVLQRERFFTNVTAYVSDEVASAAHSARTVYIVDLHEQDVLDVPIKSAKMSRLEKTRNTLSDGLSFGSFTFALCSVCWRGSPRMLFRRVCDRWRDARCKYGDAHGIRCVLVYPPRALLL